MLIAYACIDVAVLAFGLGLSIISILVGMIPSWPGWALVACLVVAGLLLCWQTLMCVHWAMLFQRAADRSSAIGDWSLGRGAATVRGLLVPEDPADADLFAYRIMVELSEATGHAEVHVQEEVGRAD